MYLFLLIVCLSFLPNIFFPLSFLVVFSEKKKRTKKENIETQLALNASSGLRREFWLHATDNVKKEKPPTKIE